MSILRGWRANMALNCLKYESNDWNADVAKRFVVMEALKSSKNHNEALQFLSNIDQMGTMEIHFWSGKFLLDRTKTRKAWRAFYL